MNTQKIVDKTYYWIDQTAKEQTLKLARLISRRHFLSRLGAMLAGVATLPLLPVSRAFAQDSLQEIEVLSHGGRAPLAVGRRILTCCYFRLAFAVRLGHTPARDSRVTPDL